MILRKRQSHRAELHVSFDDPTSDSDPSLGPALLYESTKDKKAEQDREYAEWLESIETILQPRLSGCAYQAFILVVVDRLSHEEAAEVMSCSTKTIQRACNRAVELLIKYELFFPRRNGKENENGTSES